MIKVSRLNGSELVVNAELIETIETTPDTVISLTSGKKLIVREPLDEVVERAIAYRRRIGAGLAPAAGAPLPLP
ncbi:MAG: flagellar FlbD family protein [Chloroflexi bacterium]|nr:flagellar FlbD family protein [Chloroflexota bacterium]